MNLVVSLPLRKELTLTESREVKISDVCNDINLIGCQASGDILFFFSEKLLGEINVAAKTLCGKIDYSGLKELHSLHKSNNSYEMCVGNIKNFEKADVRIQTESGGIRIEKTMEA